MGGFLQRGLLLYLFLAIAVTFAAPQVVFSDGSVASNTVLGWFDLTYDESTGEVITASNFSTNIGSASNFTSPTTPSGTSSIIGFIDPVWQVFSWIPLIFKVVFSPIILFTDPQINMPVGIVLLIAIPLVLLMLVGLISWIRSGIA